MSYHLATKTERLVYGGVTEEPTVSYDGRYVAFSTAAGVLTGDTNGVSDVYRWAPLCR